MVVLYPALDQGQLRRSDYDAWNTCSQQLAVQRIGTGSCFVDALDGTIALNETLQLSNDGCGVVGKVADVAHFTGSSLLCHRDRDRRLVNIKSYKQMAVWHENLHVCES